MKSYHKISNFSQNCLNKFFWKFSRKYHLEIFFLYFYSVLGGLHFTDILPEDSKDYDKMRPPKKEGEATSVFFHVTVMGLDSIDENSMVINSK